jgi:SHS2 domain-containing protein
MDHYKLLDHTADIGIDVWGETIENVFVHAARAMYDLIADINTIKPAIPFSVIVTALDKDELLQNWLSELLYYFHTKDILLSNFCIESMTPASIDCLAHGEKIDLSRHKLKHDIKAVTFHNLHIRESKSGFQTDIIFDV